MDLVRHLRFFVAVADEGHFGRAAAALDMTQPPLSQGLRRLEQHLGVDLIHRTRQGAVLTSAGIQLLPRARLLVDDADRLHAESQRIANSRGAIHWGATSALPDGMVTACVTALRTRLPADTHSAAAESGIVDGNDSGATVSTTIGTTVELVNEVRAGVCDFAVVEHPALVDGVAAGPVVKLPRWVVVPDDHRSAGAERPTFPMLAGLAFAGPPRAANPPAFDTVVDLLRERGLDVPVEVARDDRTLFAAVAAGTSFGLTATPPSGTPGVAWLRLAPQAIALRLRVIRRPEAAAHADVIDRVLYRERLR
ncbi:LysR family transcriptional regulator [Nocardia sp. NPDC127526]|uniref:LysR family transcriptional regulator n=1 Tax=Nocardia sp. NPDC127526 TaxID=3345393 RepID=UPI00363CF638